MFSKIVTYFALFLIFAGVISMCTDDTPTYDYSAPVKPKKVETEYVPPKKSWYYREDMNRMDGTKSNTAFVESITTVHFSFPYEGGTKFTLSLRNRKSKNEVILSLDKGAFMHNIMGEERIRLKFDDNKPYYVSYGNAADGSSTDIFLTSSERLIRDIKKSSKLAMEITFFQEGTRYIEFELPEGLKWEY